MTPMELVIYAIAAAIGIVGSARLTRLVVADSYPPSVKLRIWWKSKANDYWEPLLTCPWCFAPYVVLGNLAYAYLSNLHLSWWLINGWLAASYVASWIVYHDEG